MPFELGVWYTLPPTDRVPFHRVAGPRVWNSLPAHLRNEEITYGGFRRELKTFLADRTYGRAIGTVLRPSSSSSSSSVTLCIVAKRCVLEQKLLLRAYR